MLWQREAPQASYQGIGVIVLSLLVMPILARGETCSCSSDCHN